MDHHLRYRIYLIKRRSVSDNALRSLSKEVFERLTSTRKSFFFAFFVGGLFIYFYLPAFLDTGLPRGNVHERNSGPMRGAISTQSHNP